jgi:hypothetical protein
MASVVAMATSKSKPAFIDLGHHVLQTGVVCTGIDRRLGIVGENQHADLLAGAIGKRRGTTRIIWSPAVGSTPSRKESSTVSSNFAFGNFCKDVDRIT